ncbi:TetR family transcriptional regulator [Undibacterium sp. Di24W]|uniref:TetR family transcriptional regulator n=1 Tax=Undibacterium sp. Di24W TaxID=3413033 RepID=UPI003BF3D95E
MKTRALTSDDKYIKRSIILNAARELFLANDRQLPAVANIANQAGLAKGTVYLYFSTKEEIFLALLAEEFAGLLGAIHGFLNASTNHKRTSKVQRQEVASGLITEIATYLKTHPEFLRLDAMSYSVLEQNLSDEFLYAFKVELTRSLVDTGKQLDKILSLEDGRGASLLLRTYALMRGLWQSLDYPEHLQKLLSNPIFAPIRPEFHQELTISLNEYWRGALA